MRFAALSAARAGDRTVLRERFPDRVNWAARVVHVSALTGVAMALTGPNDVSFARAWVGVGLVLYFALAYWLEARTLPAERALVQVIHGDAEIDGALASVLQRDVDVALFIVALALVTMVVQF
jgi:hypothetical protein